jgi:hypothetical protein
MDRVIRLRAKCFDIKLFNSNLPHSGKMSLGRFFKACMQRSAFSVRRVATVEWVACFNRRYTAVQ